MADNKVRVEVETAFKDAGVKNASQAFKDLEKNIGGAASGSKVATNAIEALGKEGSAAKNVFEGLNQTMYGGTGAVFGLAKAWHAFKAAVQANPLTAIGAVILGLLPLLIQFGKSLLGIGTDAKIGAANATSAFAETKSAGEKLNEIKFDAFKQELDDVAQRANAAAGFVEKLFDIQGRVEKAKMDLELSEVDADPSLSPEQKKERSARVRSRYAERGSAREQEKSDELIAIKRRSATDLRGLANEADATLSAQRARVEANRRAPEERTLVERELTRQRDDLIAERTKLSRSGIPGDIGKSDALAKEQQAIEGTLGYLKHRSAAAQSPGALTDAKTQMDALARAEAAAKDAKARAQKAEADLAEAEQLKSLEDTNRPIIRGIERRREGVETRGLERDTLGSVGRGISDALNTAQFEPQRFSALGYFSQSTMERDRSAVQAMNVARAGAFPGAIAKAQGIAEKLGDGQGDEGEAKQLDAILTSIGNNLDKRSRSQLQPLVQALRQLEQRLSRTEQQTSVLQGQIVNGRDGK